MPVALLVTVLAVGPALAQIQFTDAQTAIQNQIQGLRSLSDADREQATRKIALDIRHLPASENKVLLADGLANHATEGDFAIPEVAETLQRALKELPAGAKGGQTASQAYEELAELSRYEHIAVRLRDPGYMSAAKGLAVIDRKREAATFTLRDMAGNSWSRSSLKGKVVLVNFWATWCPPCRKEMPDLGKLYARFKDRGLVVLAISAEKDPVVRKFVTDHSVAFPVLLDPEGKVNERYAVDGIPKSFIYDRSGKLVAQAMDMRRIDQFLAMLSKAGLR